MKMIFVRHGEAESNLSPLNRKVGQHASLTETGRDQIRSTAELLGQFVTTTVVYASPYPRTLESASIIAARLQADIVIEERLQEIQKGSWEGRLVSEIIEAESKIDVDERHTFRPPGGENWQDVGERVASFVEELRMNDETEGLAVSHDHPIRMGIGALLNKPVHTWEDMPVHHASVTVLEYKDDKWQITPDF